MANMFCLNLSLRKFGLWNFFTNFLAVCMADLLCICANVLAKCLSCWFKIIIFNPSQFFGPREDVSFSYNRGNLGERIYEFKVRESWY